MTAIFLALAVLAVLVLGLVVWVGDSGALEGDA